MIAFARKAFWGEGNRPAVGIDRENGYRRRAAFDEAATGCTYGSSAVAALGKNTATGKMLENAISRCVAA